MGIIKRINSLILIILLSMSYCPNIFAHDYVMTYLFGGTTTQYNNYVNNTNNIVNTVSPDYFEINPDGSLYYNKIDRAFIQNMHDQNKQVTPYLSNNWDRALGIAALDNTEGITSEIAKVITDYGLDGINVDIENVSHLHRDAYTNFVKRLREKLPNKVVAVSVAANPNGWQTGWHGSYDYAKLSEYSDYLMIMGYDESYYGGPAGPVASISFSERSILYALKYAPSDKLVLGIPFFGRYWKEGSAVGGNGITNLDIDNLINKYETKKTYHADSQSAELTLVLKDGEVMPKLWGGRILDPGTYTIWYDDSDSTKYKLDLVEKYKLKGSGSWALGEDKQDIWNVYASYKTTSPMSTEPTEQTPNTTGQVPMQTEQVPVPYAKYSSHLQSIGWEPDFSKINGETTGSTGKSRRLEAIKIAIENAPSGASISYQTHIQNIGWQDWKNDGDISGTTGKGLRAECIRIKLNNMPGYHLEYRAHVQNIGWQNWVRDGGESGTTGQSLRLEALQIKIVKDSNLLKSSTRLNNPLTNVIRRGWFTIDEFNKDSLATRADAVKLIMRMATNLPDPTSYVEGFNDTGNHKDIDFILKAKYYGVIKGDEQNNFYPDRTITKEEFVMLLDRVFYLPDTVDFDNNIAKDISMTSDGEGFYAINKYLAHEIFTVDAEGNFYPNSTLTMGDLAIVAEKMVGVGLNEIEYNKVGDQELQQKIIEPR